MTGLGNIFAELGLTHYLDDFIEQGFDTWETILDITESDFDALGVKLGHRRKLQRKIANTRGFSSDQALESQNSPPPERVSADDQTKLKAEIKECTTNGAGGGVNNIGSVGAGTTVPTAKRKYRRHPKPDENAPERPPSAYVIFSNKMREDLKGRNLSFTEIAKFVGERWQNLSPSEKEHFEQQAFTAKERYVNQLMEYKKTSLYKKYSLYLAEFKARHSNQNSGSSNDIDNTKRPKLDAASNSSNGSLVTCANSQAGENGSSGSSTGGSTSSTCSNNSRLDSISSVSTPSSNCSWFRPWDVDHSPTRDASKIIPTAPGTFPALGPKSPISKSLSVSNGYRESNFTNRGATSHQNYSLKDYPREESIASTPQSYMKIIGFNERPILSDPTSSAGSYRNVLNQSDPIDRTTVDKPESLNPRPITSFIGKDSPTLITQRTSLESPQDRPQPNPLYKDQILDDKYEHQLPPIIPLSLSPELNTRAIHKQPQLHPLQPNSPYQSQSTILISPKIFDSFINISSGKMPPIRDSGDRNDYRARDFMSANTSDEIRLSPVSALLHAGDIVSKNGMERNR